MISLEPFVLLIALGVLLIGVSLSLGISRLISKPTEEEEFKAQIAEINRSELEDDEGEEKSGWMHYWETLYLRSGRPLQDPHGPGKAVIVILIIGTLFGTLIFPGGIIGAIFAPALVLFASSGLLKAEANKRSNTLVKQLPLLLSSLRANIQARSTPQSALIAVADEIPSPLGDELKILQSELNVNVPLENALANLSDRVESREIKFLVSSIDTAVASGEDLDPQLETIQRIVEQRTRIRNKLATAVSEVSVSLWVAGLTIPAAFIFSYLQSEENQQFWFGSLLGLGSLAAVIVLYLGGLFTSYKLTKGVEKT